VSLAVSSVWTDRAVGLPEPYIIFRGQENGIGRVVCGTLSEKGYLLGCYAASSGDSLPTFRESSVPGHTHVHIHVAFVPKNFNVAHFT